MIKLVLDLEKANQLSFKLEEEHQVELRGKEIGSNEVLIIVPTEHEQIFLKSLNEILEYETSLWFNTYDGKVKVYPSSCLFLEINAGDTIMVNDYYKKIILYHTLQELEEMLENLWFSRINKSQIVNLKKITYIRPLLNSKLELTLPGDIKLEVNRSYLKAFKKALKEKGGV